MDKFIIGVISDTHGLLRPEALESLKEADLIVHAGDVGKPQVLECLRSLAPVVAVRGNTDHGEWARNLPWFEAFECAKTSIYVLHDLNDLDLDPAAGGFASVISGHSHRPDISWRDGVLLLNPGSAGPRRFKLPVSVALIQVQDGKLTPRLIELNVGDQ
ncbi:MAG: metallophosphoesterase family protein [Syntrophotaleaceae bacterium]